MLFVCYCVHRLHNLSRFYRIYVYGLAIYYYIIIIIKRQFIRRSNMARVTATYLLCLRGTAVINVYEKFIIHAFVVFVSVYNYNNFA